jgi:ABC-type branched-subunit amino acid transport system substrate-binding protein
VRAHTATGGLIVKHRRFVLATLLVLGLVAASCGRSDDDGQSSATTAGGSGTTAPSGGECDKTPLKATEVGVTADSITVEVMADVGSPLAPGLFQGNVDAVNAYAKYINANGGVACRKLIVKTWDSKLNPEESKNGQIDACKNALAMVGDNSLFNPDVKTLGDCVDQAGTATGLPDVAALANDVAEQCSATTYLIQGVAETCPVVTGKPRPIKVVVGPTKWWLKETPGLHGLYLVPGDLPGTVQSAATAVKGMEGAGMKWDATLKVGGRDEQAAYLPRIQTLKTSKSNFVMNGSNDRAMVNARKEAKAQGYEGVTVWGCGLSCYTRAFAEAGADVEGTYVWLQFLPFEEKASNEELAAYVDTIGESKADSFGAQAWQAAALFKTAVDQVVDADGPNGVTRAAVLKALGSIKSFDANGWMGEKDPRGTSSCFVMMQVKGGKFVRVHPTKVGTMDCDAGNVATIEVDPVVEAQRIK